MRPLRLVLGFVLAATAAAYSTALMRVVLGFAFGTDSPYLGGVWTDIASFPLVFAVSEWPSTALVLLISVLLTNTLKRAARLDGWRWSAACALCYAIISLVLVTVMSSYVWSPILGVGDERGQVVTIPIPISLFTPYAVSWSVGDPLLKLSVMIAFVVGGALAALIFTAVTKQRPSTA